MNEMPFRFLSKDIVFSRRFDETAHEDISSLKTLCNNMWGWPGENLKTILLESHLDNLPGAPRKKYIYNDYSLEFDAETYKLACDLVDGGENFLSEQITTLLRESVSTWFGDYLHFFKNREITFKVTSNGRNSEVPEITVTCGPLYNGPAPRSVRGFKVEAVRSNARTHYDVFADQCFTIGAGKHCTVSIPNCGCELLYAAHLDGGHIKEYLSSVYGTWVPDCSGDRNARTVNFRGGSFGFELHLLTTSVYPYRGTVNQAAMALHRHSGNGMHTAGIVPCGTRWKYFFDETGRLSADEAGHLGWLEMCPKSAHPVCSIRKLDGSIEHTALSEKQYEVHNEDKVLFYYFALGCPNHLHLPDWGPRKEMPLLIVNGPEETVDRGEELPSPPYWSVTEERSGHIIALIRTRHKLRSGEVVVHGDKLYLKVGDTDAL